MKAWRVVWGASQQVQQLVGKACALVASNQPGIQQDKGTGGGDAPALLQLWSVAAAGAASLRCWCLLLVPGRRLRLLALLLLLAVEQGI